MADSHRRDQVEEFFKTHPCFFCPKLNGRIQRLYCFKRIISPKPGKGTYGSKKPDNPLDAHCRTGECPEGINTIKMLGMEQEYAKWRSEGCPQGGKATAKTTAKTTSTKRTSKRKK